MTVGESSIRTFRQLSNELTEAMRTRKRPSIKTHLIEVLRPIVPARTLDFLRRTLRPAAPRRRLEVVQLPDSPAIYEVRVGSLNLWVDTSDERIWEVHSLNDSAPLTTLIDRWIASTPDIDAPWLPEDLLTVASRSGEFVGFGLMFSRAFFTEDVEDVDYADSLSVRVSGSESRDALAQFRHQHTLDRSSALSGIRLRNPLAGPGAMAAGRLTSTLTANGRVSSRGDSFDRHRDFLRHARQLYLDAADWLARHHTVGALDAAGNGLRGPLVVNLESEVDNLATFAGRIFSGGEPFRLWGFLERRSDDLIVAQAFDVRTGTAFTVEALPKELRVFLPAGAPGAIVLRLVTLLQRHHDRRIHLPPLGQP